MDVASKIFNWGQRYDVGELFAVPELKGHEFAVVESGIRGVRINYYPPAIASAGEAGVECHGTAKVNLFPNAEA